jgi:hypothetical protein
MSSLSPGSREKIRAELAFIFSGEGDKAAAILERIDQLAEEFTRDRERPDLDEKDVWLIAYGDSLR